MKHRFLKILIASLLALTMTLPMLACDGGNASDTTPADTTATTETPTEAPKGCGSALTASLLLPVLTAAAAVGALRKGRKKERT